jgi:hypothetical protein
MLPVCGCAHTQWKIEMTGTMTLNSISPNSVPADYPVQSSNKYRRKVNFRHPQHTPSAILCLWRKDSIKPFTQIQTCQVKALAISNNGVVRVQKTSEILSELLPTDLRL